MRRSVATSALGRSAAVRERRSLRGAAQRSSGDDHVGLSFQNQRSPREPASTSSLLQHEVESSPRLERQAKSFFFAWRNLFPSLVLVFQFLSDYARSDQGQGHVFMPCFTGRRASSRSYVVFWVSPKWSHSFPGRHRSPLGLAPFVIDTPSVDVMGHARQASSTYARFDRLDIASGGRQRPSHFHPIVDTHPHTHTPIFSTQSSLVVTHAYAVGTGYRGRVTTAISSKMRRTKSLW